MELEFLIVLRKQHFGFVVFYFYFLFIFFYFFVPNTPISSYS